MKSVMKNSTPDCLKPGVLFCSANGLFKQGLQITAKGRGHLFDVGAGGIHEKVVVFPRAPFLFAEEGVIFCAAAVDLCDLLSHLRFGRIFALGAALHAALDPACRAPLRKADSLIGERLRISESRNSGKQRANASGGKTLFP